MSDAAGPALDAALVHVPVASSVHPWQSHVVIHAFRGFELDEPLFELRFEGQVVPTQTRVFGLIAYLLHHRDRVVSKDELTRELWKAAVASDTAISQVVMLARRALRDEGDSQHIIKTVRGRGFRFVAEVRPIEARLTQGHAVAASNSVADGSQPPPTAAATNTHSSSESTGNGAPGLGDTVASLGGREAPASQSRAEGLVGRARELQLLREALAGVLRGQGGLLVIEGEPGIGKTTLASALAAEAAACHVDVRWGRAWEDGGAPPYWPWIQILRAITQREGLPAVRGFLDHSTSEIVSLIPEWANGDPSPVLDLGNPQARFRLFDAVARFFRNACQLQGDASVGGSGARPRLIILDDLHAFDEASLQLLRFLASELNEMALLVVATFRDLELARSPAVAQLAERLDDARRIRLIGLTGDDISMLIAQRVGESPSAQVIQALGEVSGGNPLLLCEICRQLGPAAVATFVEASGFQAMTLPERVASAVRKQLADLPQTTRAALTTASALGKEFSTRLLSELCACAEGELLERLAPARARGLIRVSAAASDRLVFSHALVRSAVYAELPAQHKLELHRLVAETLERTRPQNRLPLFEIAHHYLLAAAGGCRPQALEYARRAAEHAGEMTAFEVSASLYDRALQIGNSDGLAPALHHELLCAAGSAWYMAGQLAQAIERFDRAASLARTEKNAERFGLAVLKASTPLRTGLWYNRRRQQDVLEALSMLPETDSALRASLLAISALCMRGEEQREARIATTRAAVEMARRLGDDVTTLRTLHAQHAALLAVTHPSDRLAIADEMVELGRKTQQHGLMIDALLCRITNYAELGDHSALWRTVDEFVTETERCGTPWHAHMVTVFGATEALSRGDFASAEQLSNRALQQGLRVQDPFVPLAHGMRALFRQIDIGVRHLPEIPALSEPPELVPPEYHAFWAPVWVNQGNRTKAAHAVTRLLDGWKNLASDVLRRPLLAVASQVCVALGDRAQLQRIYELLLPDADLHVVLQAGVFLGPVAYYLGTVSAALGDLEAAERHLRLALEGTTGRGPMLTRIQYAYGQLLDARGNSRGREYLMEAEKAALELGMGDLLEDIRKALAAVRPALENRSSRLD